MESSWWKTLRGGEKIAKEKKGKTKEEEIIISKDRQYWNMFAIP